jgi:hypothetical protein
MFEDNKIIRVVDIQTTLPKKSALFFYFSELLVQTFIWDKNQWKEACNTTHSGLVRDVLQCKISDPFFHRQIVLRGKNFLFLSSSEDHLLKEQIDSLKKIFQDCLFELENKTLHIYRTGVNRIKFSSKGVLILFFKPV